MPLGWRQVRCGAFLHSRDEFGGTVEALLSMSVANGVVPRDGDAGRAASEDLSAYRKVQPGDLVVNRLVARDGAFAISSHEGAVSPAYWVLVCNREVVEPGYLHYAFRSEIALAEVWRRSKDMPPAQFDLPWQQFKTMPLLLPPLGTQRLIADYLDRETDRIDALIDAQRQMIGTLRERRAAAIAAVLSPLPVTKRLKYLSVVQTGVTLSGEGDPADPEWPYLRVANVQIGYVDLREIKTIRISEGRAMASTLRRGDVLMTEGGDIDKLGRGAVWRGEIPNMLHQNHVFAVRPTPELDPEFLVYWLDGPVARTYFRTTAKQTTNLAGTNKWTLGNLPIPAPSLATQRRVVASLDAQLGKIEETIAETERFIELSKERRTALITAAVTGQIDVQDEVA